MVAAIARLGCGSCHEISGVPMARGRVGPPLTTLHARAVVGGVVPNSAGELARWIRTPRALDPHTAMPDLGVGDDDARDIAALLLSGR